MKQVVYVGVEMPDLVCGYVYDWRGDVYTRYGAMRRIYLSYPQREIAVPALDAPFYSEFAVCSECDGNCVIRYTVDEVYYNHEYSSCGDEYIHAGRIVTETCPSCRGTGITIDWSRDLYAQRYIKSD